MINSDNGVLRVWVPGADVRVLAVDARDLHEPTPVRDRAVLLAAGGRADLEVRVPLDGSAVRVRLGGTGTDVLVGPDGAEGRPT